MDLDEITKLKVAELRSALQERGLDSKGNKPILIERLREALQANGEAQEGSDGSQDHEETSDMEASNDIQYTDENSGETMNMEENEDTTNDCEQNGLEEEQAEGEDDDSSDEVAAEDESSTDAAVAEEVSNQPSEVSNAEEHVEDIALDIKEENYDRFDDDEDDDENIKKDEYEEAPIENIEIKKEEETQQNNGTEAEVKKEQEEEVETKNEDMEATVKQEDRDRHDRRGVKRSQSTEREDRSKKYRNEPEEPPSEIEPDIDNSVVVLDWYNSDLSLEIDQDKRLSAVPLTTGGFAYIWHGVRSNLGSTKGKIYYEVKITEHCDVSHLEKEEEHPHVLRCGWSLDCTSMILGEEKFSWGYGGTGKASTNLKFKDYGKTYSLGDVVGCFLDLDSEPAVMSFTVNGENLGVCYEITHEELEGRAMFPHVLTKNCTFTVNFGAEEPWFEPLTDYTFIGKIPVEDLEVGSQRPEKREDTEVIMMVGLPAAGKTTWVDNYSREHPERKYNVLGTNALIDKMRVMGLPRKRNYHGRWDSLIEKCTKCLNKLLGMATRRRRNFVIDQTNVYPSAQKRKIKGFYGCKRRAVVICPTDEDLKQRTKKREAEEGKDVPDKAVLEMKANFKLPEVGEFFDEVDFIELQQDEAAKLIESYNKEGERAGFGQRRHERGGRMGYGGHGQRRGTFDRRGFGYNNNRSGGGRDNWNRDRDRRGNFDYRRDNRSNDRGGRGWNRDFNNRDRSGGGNYNRDNRNNYNRDRPYRSGGGGGGGNWQGGFRNQNQGMQKSGGWGNYGQNQNFSNNSPWNNQNYGQQNSWNQQQQPQQAQMNQGYGNANAGYNWNQQYYGNQNQTAQSYWQNYANQQQQSGYTAQGGYNQGSYNAQNTGYNYNQQATTGQSQTGQNNQWGGNYSTTTTTQFNPQSYRR